MDGTRDQALSVWGNAYTTGDPNTADHRHLRLRSRPPRERHGLVHARPRQGISGTRRSSTACSRAGRTPCCAASPGINGDGQSFNDIIF
jgi:hypothetical protein